MQLKSPALLGAASTFLAVSSYLVFGGKTVSENVGLPAHFKCTVTSEACTNNPGPFITLDGELLIGAIDAVMIFRNNKKGTHEHEEEVKARVSLSSEKLIKFAKQPPLGGVGGNPFIFLQVCDEGWKPLSEKILLGRCVQGLNAVDLPLELATRIFAAIAGSCENNPGPWITLDGDLRMGGINAKLTFQNSPQPNAPHQRDESVELQVEIVSPSEGIRFSKQPPLGGVGGNPHIWVQFECKGKTLSDEIYLGRCVQLSRD